MQTLHFLFSNSYLFPLESFQTLWTFSFLEMLCNKGVYKWIFKKSSVGGWKHWGCNVITKELIWRKEGLLMLQSIHTISRWGSFSIKHGNSKEGILVVWCNTILWDETVLNIYTALKENVNIAHYELTPILANTSFHLMQCFIKIFGVFSSV